MAGRTTKIMKLPARIISTRWTTVRRVTSFGGVRRGKAAAISIGEHPSYGRNEEKVCDPDLSRKHTDSEPLVQDRVVCAVRLHRGQLGVDDGQKAQAIPVRDRKRIEFVRQELARDGVGGRIPRGAPPGRRTFDDAD